MNEHVTERIEARSRWLAQKKSEGVEGVFRATAAHLPLPPSLHDALRIARTERSVMAEYRRADAFAEPSQPLDAATFATEAVGGGVTALAVQCEEAYGTDYADMIGAAQSGVLPILALDLVVEPVQVVMARAHGASAVIVSATLLNESKLRALLRQASDLGLEVVVDVSTALELQAVAAMRIGTSDVRLVRMISVGALELHAEVNVVEVQRRLVSGIPEDCLSIAVLDVGSLDAAELVTAAGYEAVLACGVICAPNTELAAATGAFAPEFA